MKWVFIQLAECPWEVGAIDHLCHGLEADGLWEAANDVEQHIVLERRLKVDHEGHGGLLWRRYEIPGQLFDAEGDCEHGQPL
ncbi:MAG: hypothetical protein GY820_03475 [Gammaproteobacteria bacterium]|nr:hypothetical protein [Gammaproteobacteria bacterium]